MQEGDGPWLDMNNILQLAMSFCSFRMKEVTMYCGKVLDSIVLT